MKIGTRVQCNGVTGVVVTNTKLPGDICINWDNGQFSSYDQEYINANMNVVPEPKPPTGGEHE